jgi:hypothetical protein
MAIMEWDDAKNHRLSQTVELKIAIGTYVATGLHLTPMAGLIVIS